MYMKKTNKILVGCLALLLTLAVGYALFSETITINGTATAKGNFDIETTCTKGVPNNLQSALYAAMIYVEGIMNVDGSMMGGYPKEEGGYSNDICTASNNTVTYSANLNYPGALRYFIVKTKNAGTITAKLNTVNYYDGREFIKNETCIYNKSNNSKVKCHSNYLGGQDTLSGFKSLIAKETKTGELYTFENDVLWNYMDDEGYIYIEPGESLYFVHGLSWNEGWTDKTKYLTYEGVYELPFVQQNN